MVTQFLKGILEMSKAQIFKRIAFIGFGLINSSLARVVKRKGLATKIAAYSRSKKTRSKIENLNIVDDLYSDASEAVREADLVVLGVPLGATKKLVSQFAPFLTSGAIITDVGSVKKSVLNSVLPLLPPDIHFVPAHPIAGTEKSGPESGYETLFQGHWCILTPTKNTNKEAILKVSKLWESAGMEVAEMDAQYHDLVLAITSHIPHLVAYSIVGTVSELEDHLKTEVMKYSAGGFRDFTRIAGSDPIMWRDIFIDNKEAVLEMLGRFIEDLTALQKSIRWEDKESLEKLFNKTRLIRKGVVAFKQD